MRVSKHFTKTRHNPPCDADSKNAELLTQAGFIEKLGAGIYNLLPLGHRVYRKVCQIIREEMNDVEGQEILMPALHPIDIWKQTGRDRTMDDILYRTTATGSREFVFGPSHEEAVTPLAAKYINSYKDLPLSVYQIQTKFRDEPRAKSGLLRGREFGMKDMYSFHTTEGDLDEYYEGVKQAYFNVYERCGLKSYLVEASGGAFTDKISHEFSVETSAGEDTILVCDKTGKAQNLEIAVGQLPDDYSEEAEKDMEKVNLSDDQVKDRGTSVADNAKVHGVENYKILKTVVYEVEEGGLIGVVIRGDLSVNEVKLEKYLQARLRPASPEKLKDAGLVQGYISPIDLPDGIEIRFVADHSVKSVKNYVTGANEFGVDLVNVNIGRDFIAADFADLVEVKAGFKSEEGGELREVKAIEAGNIFKLGTIYSEAFNLNFTDQDGKSKPVVMGCYGIGTTRLIGTVVEASHDESGIIWPMSIAPYQAYLISIGKDEEVLKACDELYEELTAAGVEVLYDDRTDSPGVKFKDADLIGIPIRLVIGRKTLENGKVEWKLRNSEDLEMLERDAVLEKVKSHIADSLN